MLKRIPQIFYTRRHFAVELANDDCAPVTEQNIARAVIVCPKINECGNRARTADNLGRVSSLRPFCGETT